MNVFANRTRVIRRACAGALTLFLMAGTLGAGPAAQRSVGRRFETGLHTFPRRHTARVVVVEIGTPTDAARVSIELRDAKDSVVARTEGKLRRGEPVQLDMPLTYAATQLRATVSIVSSSTDSRPATTVEDIDVDALSVIPKVYCAAGPASGRDSPQTFCPGWEATSFVP